MINNRVKKIVTAGVLSALVVVLGATGLGFIPLPLGAVTILQVPAIIGAILEGPLVGAFVGLLFGLFSIVQAALIGTTPLDLAFLNYPWIAIVPRVLIGIVAWFFYALISGTLLKKADASNSSNSIEESSKPAGIVRETIAVAAAAIAGSLANTALVLSALAFVIPEIVTWQIVAAVASLNGTVEAAFSAAITLAVVLSWKGISKRQKSKLNEG